MSLFTSRLRHSVRQTRSFDLHQTAYMRLLPVVKTFDTTPRDFYTTGGTMKFRKSRKAPQPAQARHLERQTNEILDLVLSEVRLQSIPDLLSICSVSRQFYILTIPHLYRNTTVDLRRTSHLRLLRRLKRPDSHVSKTIRQLCVVCVDEKQADHLDNVQGVFDGLVNLEELEWCGPIDMPVSMLDALHTRFRGARVNITYWREPKEISEPGVQLLQVPNLSIMDTAASMITSMGICLYDNDEHQGILWAGFRKDLIGMVIRCTALTSLSITATSIGDNRCTTISQFMGAHTLPKLVKLYLNVQDSPVFSYDELQHWGTRGGWEDLMFLSLYYIQSLIPFVGRTPVLENLFLMPRDGEDTTELEARLNEFEGPSQFPSLRRLRVRSPWDNGLPVHYADHVVPWYLLTLLPLGQLLSLNITRPWNVADISSVPQAQDVRKIRISCPNLKVLSIDIWLPYSSSSGSWPTEVIRELSAFDKSIQLLLFIRGSLPASQTRLLKAARRRRFTFRCSNKMAWCFWKERQSQRALHKIPFSIQLIHTSYYDTENLEATRILDVDHLVDVHKKRILGVHCRLYCYPYSTINRESLDRMSVADLVERTKSRWKCLWGDQALCKREIRHRNNLGVAAPGGYENDPMLYDILMHSVVK